MTIYLNVYLAAVCRPGTFDHRVLLLLIGGGKFKFIQIVSMQIRLAPDY